MPFTVFAVETVTGRNLGPLDCQISSWNRVLNGSETATLTFPPDEASSGLSADTRDWYRQVTEPARMSIVIDWNGTVVWAGPIVNRARAETGAVTVNASGILWLLARRKLADPASATPVGSQVFTYSGDYGYIAQQLVAFTLARAGGRLPITLPGLAAGTNHTLNYNGADLSTIADLLSNLTGLVNGPDIDFAPAWTDSSRAAIVWQMRVGSDAAPKLTSPNQLAFDLSSPHAGVRGLQATDDVSTMATVDWAKGATPNPVSATDSSGNVTTVDQPPLLSLAQSNRYVDLGWPLLETENDYATVNIQATLDAHTAGDLATYATSTDQWTVTVDADTDPRLGSYQLGDLPTVRSAGDLWIPDGIWGMRIVQISGSDSTSIALTMQSAASRALRILHSPDQSLPARIRRLERLSPFT